MDLTLRELIAIRRVLTNGIATKPYEWHAYPVSERIRLGAERGRELARADWHAKVLADTAAANEMAPLRAPSYEELTQGRA